MGCAHCGNTTRPTHWSDAAGAELCEDCYCRLPSSSAEIGRELGIPPCPRCGEPLGARYLPEQVCWPCTGLAPITPAPIRPTRLVRFVQRVWSQLEDRTGLPVAYVDGRTIAAHCPACRVGTLSILFLDGDPPRLVVRSQALGAGRCSLGCSADQIREALQ